MRCQPATLLCDGRRVVADALQLVRYVVQGQQESQITRDRRLGCDRRRDQRRDVALDLVDLAVGNDHGHRRLFVVCHQSRQRGADLIGDDAAHAQHVVLDLAHLPVEDGARARDRDRRAVDRHDHRRVLGEAAVVVLGLEGGRRFLAFEMRVDRPAHPNRPDT